MVTWVVPTPETLLLKCPKRNDISPKKTCLLATNTVYICTFVVEIWFTRAKNEPDRLYPNNTYRDKNKQE